MIWGLQAFGDLDTRDELPEVILCFIFKLFF